MFDFAKFAILVHRLKTRVEQLNNDPPESLEDYTKLAEEIEGLIAEIKGQRQSPDFDTAAFKAARAEALKGYGASDADLDRLPPIDLPPVDPPPTGILDSDPGMQAFPKDVYVTTSQPFKYLIHSGRVGDPVPNQFSPAIAGVDEPGWHILHNSQRSRVQPTHGQ